MIRLLTKLFTKKKSQKQTYLEKHGCDSCCPKCKKWESEGNTITNSIPDNDPSIDVRTCENCGHTWKAIFTPAGFVPVD